MAAQSRPRRLVSAEEVTECMEDLSACVEAMESMVGEVEAACDALRRPDGRNEAGRVPREGTEAGRNEPRAFVEAARVRDALVAEADEQVCKEEGWGWGPHKALTWLEAVAKAGGIEEEERDRAQARLDELGALHEGMTIGLKEGLLYLERVEALWEATPRDRRPRHFLPCVIRGIRRKAGAEGAAHLITAGKMRTNRGGKGRSLVRAPALAALIARPLHEVEAQVVEVDGPFASRFTGNFRDGRGRPCRAYRSEDKGQGELLPGPGRLGGEEIDDVVIASMTQAELTADERDPLRGDVVKLAKLAYALTARTRLSEGAAAHFLGGGDTRANRARANRAAWAARGLGISIRPREHKVLELVEVAAHPEGFDLWSPAWWREQWEGVRSYRLTAGLFRPPLPGAAHGPEAGYWGGLHRTVDGLESALTWGHTAGRGRGGRVPDNVRPVENGGPGPEVFFAWHTVLRCAGEPVSASEMERGRGGKVRRYNARVNGLLEAGYGMPLGACGTPTRGAAPAGDSIEVRRVRPARGRGAGLMVRASARFCEAYARGQNRKSWERIPAGRLLGTGKDG